ncbi:alpha/beta fold hydrolase [Mycolicibacterium sp. CH28]|uniref:alpha/beta fold hydrolase n=1 Tax=Mycolicibacterium sp. CH28 TaxID=2512237 RepID=UPI001080856E|nr:alpha/beta hydrolase [Mycolicibacterium sp. CH28]TGD89992.1 alpha/beta fold hydrolase [Mycolicibacterium sp. CH28]
MSIAPREELHDNRIRAQCGWHADLLRAPGAGTPILFLHEFAGDMSNWDVQVADLGANHLCLRFNARGYPPSEVPEPGRYSQQRAVEDAIAVLDAVGVERAHLVGSSMGGYTALNIATTLPRRVLSTTVAACGLGSDPTTRTRFAAEYQALSEALRNRGWAAIAEDYCRSPNRIRLLEKDDTAWRAFRNALTGHSSDGCASTIDGVQLTRPSLEHLIPRLARHPLPLLIISGDDDDGLMDVNLWMKRTVPGAAWAVFPRTGHATNLEEPRLFVDTIRRFISSVDNPVVDPPVFDEHV